MRSIVPSHDSGVAKMDGLLRLSDQERCRLALRLSTMGHATDMIVGSFRTHWSGPSWYVFSNGTLEDKWTCAIASATLLSVDAPLRPLLERGDFHSRCLLYGMCILLLQQIPFRRLYDEMEWVEEGLRAPLWTAIRLHSSGVLDDVDISRYQEQDWSSGRLARMLRCY